MSNGLPWVVVLAAGAGTRLQQLTTAEDGIAVPKQFCSLRGGRSLLIDALSRARELAPLRRIVVVVAQQHERWWRPQLGWLDQDNLIVQPENRGTAAGILLPLLCVLNRDPEARVVVMPSDHHVDEPRVLVGALQQALVDAAHAPDKLVLLGITPDAPDTEYGWIVPGPPHAGLRAVSAFVEKPERAKAALLLRAGAVWNSFLFAAQGAAILHLCRRSLPATVAGIASALAVSDPEQRSRALAAAYGALSKADFSHEVLGGAPEALLLRAVPECGWTDLGTPPRVAACLQRILQQPAGRLQRAPWFPTVDLARVLQRRPVLALQGA